MVVQTTVVKSVKDQMIKVEQLCRCAHSEGQAPTEFVCPLAWLRRNIIKNISGCKLMLIALQVGNR